jgi:hypothetical protein
MAAVAVYALALAAGPPRAYVATPGAHVPLARSAWCWGGLCAAPIEPAKRTVVLRRGDTIHVELGFAPRTVAVDVNGIRTRVRTAGHEVTWIASRGGGITIRVTSARGWVTYVGRLRLR